MTWEYMLHNFLAAIKCIDEMLASSQWSSRGANGLLANGHESDYCWVHVNHCYCSGIH